MGKKILIIEDEKAIQDVMRRALEGAGYEVVLAHDGVEALERLRIVTPDLIVLDLMMPRMNGYRFVEELEYRGLRSTIPIVVVAAYVNPELMVQMQIKVWLTKPFRLQHLRETVDHCIHVPLP